MTDERTGKLDSEDDFEAVVRAFASRVDKLRREMQGLRAQLESMVAGQATERATTAAPHSL